MDYLKAWKQAFPPSNREENVKVVCNAKYLSVKIYENITWKN